MKQKKTVSYIISKDINVFLQRKTKINSYVNLDEKDITDNKFFWKTAKSLLSDKSINSGKIHLSENGELINSESRTTEVLNDVLSNIERNFKIPDCENPSPNPKNDIDF